MATEIILNQLFIFLLLGLAGALFTKFSWFNAVAKDVLARVIIDITLPFLIFTTFSQIQFNQQYVKSAVWVFIFTFVNLFVLHVVGGFSSKLLKLNKQQSIVHQLHTMFGNIVFLGFPLIDALFPGGIGIFYAAIYQFASNSITFTYGVYSLSSGTQKAGYKSLLNINSIAIFAGLLVYVLKIPLPGIMIDAFHGLGKCTSPLSMIYIGALIAGISFKQALKSWSSYVLSALKLLVIPILLTIIYFFLITFFNISLDPIAFYVIVLQAAMPCQAIVVVLTRRYNGDYVLATNNLIISTLLSIITLPLLFLMIHYFTGF